MPDIQNVYYIDNKDVTDPLLNLALEEYAVRNLKGDNDYVLIYVNQPSVIVGKHQNVLEEVNVPAAAELNIPIIRRISGGGTVYHDTGNLNISMITKHTLKNFNKYSNFLKPVIEVLRDLSLKVRMDDRNNLILDNKKISGNAQFTAKQRLLSHGTLLVNSDLNIMNKLIKSEYNNAFDSKSTKSIRSMVTNIKDYLNINISVSDLKQYILNKIFYNGLRCYTLNEDQWQDVVHLCETKYKTWQWNMALSPDCKVTRNYDYQTANINMDFRVSKGFIQTFHIKSDSISEKIAEKIQRYFKNQSIDYVNIKTIDTKLKKDLSIIPYGVLPWIDLIYN